MCPDASGSGIPSVLWVIIWRFLEVPINEQKGSGLFFILRLLYTLIINAIYIVYASLIFPAFYFVGSVQIKGGYILLYISMYTIIFLNKTLISGTRPGAEQGGGAVGTGPPLVLFSGPPP